MHTSPCGANLSIALVVGVGQSVDIPGVPAVGRGLVHTVQGEGGGGSRVVLDEHLWAREDPHALLHLGQLPLQLLLPRPQAHRVAAHGQRGQALHQLLPICNTHTETEIQSQLVNNTLTQLKLNPTKEGTTFTPSNVEF